MVGKILKGINLPGSDAVALSPDEASILAFSFSGAGVGAWDARTGAPRFEGEVSRSTSFPHHTVEFDPLIKRRIASRHLR